MLNEDLLNAWVGMTSMFKNTRLTKELTYNEATVLLFAWNRYQAGEPTISVKELLSKTKMQKSLLNRTLDMLEKKHLITKSRSDDDARLVMVALQPDHLDVFQAVHERSLEIIDWVITVIGEEDAESFIRIYSKLSGVHRPTELAEQI